VSKRWQKATKMCKCLQYLPIKSIHRLISNVFHKKCNKNTFKLKSQSNSFKSVTQCYSNVTTFHIQKLNATKLKKKTDGFECH